MRNADADLNPDTDPDPGWLSLLVTPPYPAYTGNVAGIGAERGAGTQLALGSKDIPVSVTTPRPPHWLP